MALQQLTFGDLAARSLPVDKCLTNAVRLVANACFSRMIDPQPLLRPKVIAESKRALDLLGLSSVMNDEYATDVLSGGKWAPGSVPLAHNYCGYQFRNFAGQLGDGAAVLLGDVLHQGTRWEVQLKGAGRTPYSRMGDGRKVLRSSFPGVYLLRSHACAWCSNH